MIKRYYDHYHENTIKMESDELVSKARGLNKNIFLRKRKFFVDAIIKYIIGTKKERNQKLKNLHLNEVRDNKMSITNQGVDLQRLKLNPEAVKYLALEWVKSIYADKDYDRVRQIKGYYVCAIDGMDLVLPTSDEGYEFFGGSISNKGVKTVQASSSCIYDVVNRVLIDANINPFKTSERDSAMKNIESLDELIPYDKKILLLDRGYISLKLLLDLFQYDHKFVMRIPSSTYKNEISNMATNDELIRIEMTKERLNSLRDEPYYDQLLSVHHIVVRAIKFTLSSGMKEVLITNLDPKEFNFDEIKELYRLRWEIETVYNALKNKIELEKFSGFKPVIIKQDFYASIYLWNMMQDMILDARGDLDIEERNTIHEMKINDSMAIGIIRNNLLRIFYIKDRKKEDFKAISDEIMNHIEPIRPNRSFPRNINKKDTTTESYKTIRKNIATRKRAKRKAKRK